MPVDLKRKKRVMLNVDRYLMFCIDEAAALERRTVTQWMTNAIEDQLLTLPAHQLNHITNAVEAKLESIKDEAELQELEDQAHDYLTTWDRRIPELAQELTQQWMSGEIDRKRRRGCM